MPKTIAVLLLVAFLPAQPARRTTVREEIEKQYEKLSAANVRKDIKAMDTRRSS